MRRRGPYAAIGTAAAGIGFAVYMAVAGPLAVFKMALTNSGDLPPCVGDPGCVLDVYATSTAVVAFDGDGGTVAVQNPTANGFEAAPMVSGSGATVWAAKDITDGTAPYISAADAQTVLGATFYSSDHTVMCTYATTANAGANPLVFNHGTSASSGLNFELTSSGQRPQCTYSSATAAQAVNLGAATNYSSRWTVHSCIRSGSTYIVRANGTEASPAGITQTSANPSASNIYFGRYGPTGGFAMRGPLYRCRFWNTALSSATKSIREAQLLKGLATRPSETYVMTVRASAAFDVYADGYVYASGDNVRIPHSTKGLQSFATSLQLLPWSYAFDNASWVKSNVTVTPNADSGPFSRYAGGAEAERIQSTANAHDVYQAVTVSASTAYNFFFWAKNNGGTRAKYRVYDATGAADIIANTSYLTSINGTSYSLITVPFTTPAGCTSVRVYPVSEVVAGTDLFVSGAHVQAATAPVVPCPRVDATGLSCAADVHSFPGAGLPTTSGEISLSFTPNIADATTNQMLLDSRTTATTQGVDIYRTTTERIICDTWAAANVCTVQSAILTFTPGTAKAVECRWDATSCTIVVDGVAVSAVATGSPASHNSAAKLGADNTNALQANGWISSLCAGRPGACP